MRRKTTHYLLTIDLLSVKSKHQRPVVFPFPLLSGFFFSSSSLFILFYYHLHQLIIIFKFSLSFNKMLLNNFPTMVPLMTSSPLVLYCGPYLHIFTCGPSEISCAPRAHKVPVDLMSLPLCICWKSVEPSFYYSNHRKLTMFGVTG